MKFKEFIEAIYTIHAELPSKEWFKSIPKKDREDYLGTAMKGLVTFKLTEALDSEDNNEPTPTDVPEDVQHQARSGSVEKSKDPVESHDDSAGIAAHSIDVTLAERGTNYGKFTNHAELSQRLKVAFDNHVREYGQPEKYTDSMNEAVEMVFHKLARIANGDPTYIDSWTDISGYSTLIVKELNGESI